MPTGTAMKAALEADDNDAVLRGTMDGLRSFDLSAVEELPRLGGKHKRHVMRKSL
jgi:hypothetical protein